jgi:glutathione peroxidase
MFSKVDVNGEQAAPIYKYLTALETKPKGKGDITWNFEKFVIGKNGEVVARFAPRTAPDAPEVLEVNDAELAK